MVYVLQQLTEVLPQRGFVLEFKMNEENIITQKVQFDTKSDAAYYLNSIIDYPWVDEAVISEAKTTDIVKTSGNEQVKTALAELEKANILPRYYAEYEIRLNIPQLKKASEKDKKMAIMRKGAVPHEPRNIKKAAIHPSIYHFD